MPDFKIFNSARAAAIPCGLLALVALLTACTVAAIDQLPEGERRANALNKTIMCPVCPGESIDQSQNALAVQMRGIVQEKLSDGWDDDQIKEFFVERYGPSVLLEPPTAGFSLAAWIVPPVAFGMAVVALLLTLRWMRISGLREESQAVTPTEDRDYESRVDDAIGPIGASASARDDQKRGDGDSL